MKNYRQVFAATLVLLFADVAADPLQPVQQSTTAETTSAATESQPEALTALSRYFLLPPAVVKPPCCRNFYRLVFRWTYPMKAVTPR